MKHVTAFLLRGAAIPLLAMMLAAPAWAQFVQTDGADLFAERNGIGTDCTMMSNPCDLQAAITAATAVADTVWVRVREEGSNTRIDDDIATGATGFAIATYEEGEGPVKGVVTLEGDVMVGAAITVAEGTTLVLESDDVTIGDAGEVDGDLTLGGAGMQTLNLPGGAACVDASGIGIPGQSPTFNRLTIDGDVEVETPGCPAGSGFTAEVTVDHSLEVKSGATLDMGGVRLKLLPTLEMDGDKEIRGSAQIDGAIEGREALVLMVEAESTMPAAPKDTILVHDTEAVPWTRACITVGAYFPSGCMGSPVTLPATPMQTDIGQIIRIIAATDDTPGRLTILPFALTDGYPNTPAGCFNVAGSGSINLDILKTGDPTDADNVLSQGGACVGVPEVGDGGTTVNESGALFFTGTTRLDGSIRTVGRARTEFWKLEEITEEVELLGEDPVATLNVSGFVGNPMLPDASSVLAPTCDGAGHSSRASGVYFYSPVQIAGGLFLDNTDSVNRMRTIQDFDAMLPGTRCQEGVYFMGDGDPAKGNDPTAADVTPTRSSRVFGPVEARGRSYIRLDDWNFYHNLILEDDIDAEFGDTFVMTSPARVRSATDTNAGVKIAANVCGFTDTRTARGNKVVFAGGFDQDIRFPADTTLAIDAIEISKSSADGTVEVGGTGKVLRVWNLEMTSGELTTNGTLDMSIMPSVYPTRISHLVMHPEGTLDKGTAEFAYAARTARPWRLQYTGAGEHSSGDEIYAPYESGTNTLVYTLGWLDVFKPAGDKVTLNEDVAVANFLDLHSGILEVADGKELRVGRSAFVEYGSGSLGEGDVFFVSGSPLTYNPLLHGLNLRYLGAEDRTAGSLWLRSSRITGLPATASVVVDGSQYCEKASPTIQLLPGASRFELALTVTQGALDLAGNHLVAYATRINQGQRITIGSSGTLCDSAAGLSCAASAGAPGREYYHDGPLATLASTAAGAKPDRDGEKTLPVRSGQEGALFAAISADDEGMRIAAEDAPAEFTRPEGVPPAATSSVLVDAIDEGVRMLRRSGTAAAARALGEHLGQLRSSRTSTAKSARVGGYLHIGGNGDTEIRVVTQAKTRALPNLVVWRDLKHTNDAFERNGSVTISGSGIAPDPGSNGKPNLDGVSLLSLTVEHGRVLLDSNLDELHVAGNLVQFGGTVLLHANASDLSPRPDDGPWGVIPQHMRVSTGGIGGGHVQTGGTLEANGGEVTAYGDFVLGTDTGAVALFDLGGGTHTVTGDFAVGFNLPKADGTGLVGRTRYAHGGGCAADRVADAEDAGTTIIMGDFAFAGTGECYNDEQYTDAEQGLSGTVVFMGDSTQSVLHVQDPDAYFGSVSLQSTSPDGAGGIVLETPVTQNAHGTLTLRRGVVDTVNELYAWSMHNAASETDLAGRNTATEGGVMYGSRDSYVNGTITRTVSQGLAGGGVVTGGYLFPVGAANTDTTATRQVDHFRPLTMQFPADLGASGTATVNYIQQLTPALVEWPDDGLVVDGHGGGTVTLDALGSQFWAVLFDDIPAHDPNIRVAAQGLPNVFDAKGLRLIQWDCDPTNLLMPPSNPRLAGVYDLEEGPVDDKSFAVNDRINGILNLTQEGLAVGHCNIIGIAANFLQNPINMPPVSGGFANVQYIQNVADTPVDLYMDGRRIGNDWGFQTATPFANVVGGEHTLDVVAAGDADNSNPLASVTHTFVHDRRYNVVLHGDAEIASVKVVEDVRMQAANENSAEFYVVHGARELGPIDIRLLNPIDNTEVLQLVANNIDWDDVGAYISLAPGGYNFEITTANNDRQIDVFRLELREFQQQTFVLNLSGSGKSSMEGVGMLGVENDGSTFFPSVITAAEAEEELPTEFALKGNYPNPFNPSTNIQIDLPEDAEVVVQIIDLLGRQVMTIPAHELKAGARRTVEVNASGLASGTYLYRVIATSATGSDIGAGRMVLVK